MRFVWQIEDAQWSWKSLSYMFQTEERTQRLWQAREDLMDDDKANLLYDRHPGLFVAALWFDRFLQEDEEDVKYGDMTWGGCARVRSEEHTSELQSLMRISYAVFCLKKKTTINTTLNDTVHAIK